MSNCTLKPRPFIRKEKPQLVFKIFFDPESGRCLHKTTGDNVGILPYIVVDHATYSSMDVCTNYKVVNGQIEKTNRSVVYKKLIKSEMGIFKTTKNNMIFIVDSETAGPTDTWNYYK